MPCARPAGSAGRHHGHGKEHRRGAEAPRGAGIGKRVLREEADALKLKRDISNNEIEITNQTVLLDAKKKEISTINAKYDEDKRRYVELTSGKAGATAQKK